jgi:hypothetical protein
MCVLYIATTELQTANVAYFKKKIQLSGWLAPQLIRISGFLLYFNIFASRLKT